MRVALFLVLFTIRCAAQAIAPDAANLPPHQLLALMEIVCPGQLKDEQTCKVCPKESGFPQDTQGWQVAAITFGHFTSATAQQALMSIVGCEPHVAGFGGSFLLVSGGSGFRKLWYRPGYIATDCKKVPATDGRDLLICEGDDMHQGIEEEFVYLLDLNWNNSDAQWPEQLFFLVTDSLDSCVQADGLSWTGHIEHVLFSDDGNPMKRSITVQAREGKAPIPDKIMEEQCLFNSKGGADLYKPVIATILLTYHFLYDGTKVTPAGSNPPMDGMEAIIPLTSFFVPQPGHPVKARR